jgi:hypothetical protein
MEEAKTAGRRQGVTILALTSVNRLISPAIISGSVISVNNIPIVVASPVLP